MTQRTRLTFADGILKPASLRLPHVNAVVLVCVSDFEQGKNSLDATSIDCCWSYESCNPVTFGTSYPLSAHVTLFQMCGCQVTWACPSESQKSYHLTQQSLYKDTHPCCDVRALQLSDKANSIVAHCVCGECQCPVTL